MLSQHFDSTLTFYISTTYISGVSILIESILVGDTLTTLYNMSVSKPAILYYEFHKWKSENS